MGRGRAKAKQIKVARKLKYSAPETDLSALERELRASRGDAESDSTDDSDDDDSSYDDGDEQDDYGSWASNGHG